ncbi:MAG: hypothetical protein FIA95_17320 [Gemmatimonadetes bacterium]|nr:hypothetical protein [Gemmatimonadota bacterium]
MRLPCSGISLLAALCAVSAPALAAQQARTGLEVGGVPALNFDADEGFGYGVVLELYHYGTAGRAPYVWTLQPTVFLTTEGRRDFTLFFDSPHLLPGGWRVDAFVGSEEQIATPYYGLGNDAPYRSSLETDADPYYYRFGRVRRSVALNVQRPLGTGKLRILAGVGAGHVTVKPVPEGEGTTFLAQELAGAPDPEGWANFIRAGMVWDTRDRETGTRKGTWTELLVQRADTWLGGDYAFTRTTFADRRYVPLTSRLVFANRFLVQHVTDGAPLHELHRIQTSYKQQEGLGGAKSVRGVLKNRFVGQGMFVWNAELRFRFAEFRLIGQPFQAVLSGFVDSGRVWADGVRLDELFSGLHRGAGGGLRVGMGENFVVALDVGTSDETGMPIYIGLGYLY